MKENYLKVVLSILVLVVLIQAYYLYELNKTVNEDRIELKREVPLVLPNIHSFSEFFDGEKDSFKEVERLHEEIENSFRNFENFFQSSPVFDKFTSRLHRIPRFDMKEQNGKYIITMEVPGSDNSNIETKIKDGILTVSAKVSEEKDDNTTTYYRHERRSSTYKRQIRLPSDADEQSLQTTYKNGLLIISIDKS